MKKILKYILVLLLVFLVFPLGAKAEDVVNIHLFYGYGCPHCAHEEAFLEEYLKDRDDVKLYMYEVWKDTDNQELLAKVQDKLNNKQSGVPYTVIGDKVLVGYKDGVTDKNIERYINNYLEDMSSYSDPVGEITGVSEKKETTNSMQSSNESDEEDEEDENEEVNESKVTVPILGSVDAKKVSLPILSVILGFVDGFNPCAMWILIFLITMLFNMKDRKKMWILGITFILTSGIVYLLFMLTWLNLATFISKISFIRLAVALVAVIVGVVNLVKFSNSITKKDDGCDVVDKKERKKIMTKITDITKEKKFIVAIIGVIALAASVNIIELMCSIGIPLLFTQILAMNDLNVLQYGIYMFIYILFFLIDDIVIFAISMFTLKVTGISTKYTKYSHLIGGIIMLIIGLLLIIKPELLMFNI